VLINKLAASRVSPSKSWILLKVFGFIFASTDASLVLYPTTTTYFPSLTARGRKIL
jgi:hypothetical protein